MPTLQDDDVQNKFRTLYMQNKGIQEIMEILGIPYGTYLSAYYRNTHNIRDFVNALKKERFLALAEDFSNKLMNTAEDEDVRFYAIKQKEAEFLRETLGKDNYSKKTEIDNTTPITINVKSYETEKKALVSHNENIKTLESPTVKVDVAKDILCDTVIPPISTVSPSGSPKK